jgi:hypothetical protein
MDVAESLMDNIQLRRFELVNQYNEAEQQFAIAKETMMRLKMQIAELDAYISKSVINATTNEIINTNNSELV